MFCVADIDATTNEDIASTELENPIVQEECETEEKSDIDDSVPVIVLVKMRTKYWPARVMNISPECYDAKLCKRGDELTLKKVYCKVFTPSLEMCKGQSRELKECYKVAI